MDHRALIRESVIAREPIDDRERLSLAAFIEHFDALDDPCNEYANEVHVTGSAILIGRRGVVLHLHKRLDRWLQPGGHIDPGELPWEGALREAAEETGLDVELPTGGPVLAHVDVHPGPRGHTHLDLRYVVVGADAEPSPPPGESQHVRWFDWDEAMAIADPGLVGALVATREQFQSWPPTSDQHGQ